MHGRRHDFSKRRASARPARRAADGRSRPSDTGSPLLGHRTARGSRTLARTDHRVAQRSGGRVVGARRVCHPGGAVGDDHADMVTADTSASRIAVTNLVNADWVDVEAEPPYANGAFPPAWH